MVSERTTQDEILVTLYSLCVCFVLFAVDDGAILDIVLDNFKYGPPSGYDRIMLEQSLL